jgi:hypothetical protein
LDALPTLVIPSPSGNKIVILPPPTRWQDITTLEMHK